MTDLSLERRCRRVACAYPDSERRAEVETTLMESNAGRRAPRVGDVADVVWHGVVARLRRETPPSSRLGRFGDMAAVSVVVGIVGFAVTAVVIAALSVTRHSVAYDGWWMFQAPYEIAAGWVIAAVAVATAWAASRGRVALTRVLVVASGAAGTGLFALERVIGQRSPFTTYTAKWIVLAGVVVAVPVLCTGVVARAARVVAPSWWLTVSLAAALAAQYMVWTLTTPFGWGRASLVFGVFAVATSVVAVLVLPQVWARREVVAAE